MAARRSTLSDDERARLLDRIGDLEQRMKLLEARVRREAAETRSRGRIEVGRPLARVVRTPKAERRCPGCTLELPKGPVGVQCVWCGFRFDAAELFKVKRRR
jgi:hypothetical protein